MNTYNLPTNGPEALDSAEIYVTKIGGENARKLILNANNIAERNDIGKEQVLAISALRSADSRYTKLTDESVSDFTADGRRKAGFNTTSHLISIAQMLRNGGIEALSHADDMAQTIATFTRDIVHNQVTSDKKLLNKNDVLERLYTVIAEHIDDPQNPRSLVSRIRRWKDPLAASQSGVDWVIHSDDEYLSVTGIGERLAQYLYLIYLQSRGVLASPLNIESSYQSIYRNIDRDSNATATIKHMRSLISSQLSTILQQGSVVVAGGYLPILGSQRGYSDKTGALLASAAQQINRNVVYLVEKEFPLMSADPKRVQGTQTIRRMTHFLARELFGDYRGARGGAVHPEALEMLASDDINIVVMNPEQEPTADNTTLIQDFEPQPNGVEIIASKAVPFALQISSSNIIGNPSFESDMAHWFALHGLQIQHTATSEGTVSYTFFEGECSEQILSELHSYLEKEYGISDGNTLSKLEDLSVIYCLGNNMRQHGQASRAAEALDLAEVDIHFITQGLNESVMTFLVDAKDSERAVRMLHNIFIVIDEAEYQRIKSKFRASILHAIQSISSPSHHE